METFSALLALCAGNSPVTGEFPTQRPVTRSFDVLFDLLLNKRLSKQSWGWWFETPLPPLWRHCNGLLHMLYSYGFSCNIRYPQEMHLKPKSRENPFSYNVYPSYPIVSKCCTEHAIILSCSVQNFEKTAQPNWMFGDVLEIWFEFLGISYTVYISQYPGVSLWAVEG